MLSAAFVDVDTARSAAENYYKNYAPVSDKGNEVKSVISHEYEGQVTWYGINFDKGFVIINAEDVLRPILGYSFIGQVPDADRAGGLNFKEWFDFYDKQIKVARKYSYVDESAQAEWKNIKNNTFTKASKSIMVDALLESRWDQIYPWNDLCPEKDGTWTYVGCVATAASMIARYHEWPPSGTGSSNHSQAGFEDYSSYTFSYPQMEHIVEMEWGLYPEYWETINMDAAALQNTAELCYLLGHSFSMSYGTTADGGSGANMSTASSAFQTYWFYNTDYTSIGTIVDPTAHATTIQAELDAKRPWWWAGGVHSFNLDGYTDDYWYHFNWGWGGYCDGWYQLSELVPSDTGSGGGDGDYTTNQIMISCVPNTDPFTAWPEPTNVNGSVANGEDITITWNAPSGGGTLTGYDIYKSTNGAYGELLANLGVGTTSYQDLDQVVGYYSYYIFAVYDDGISHKSSSYRTSITASANFPVIRGLEIATIGRTSIDLLWAEPFLGTINAVEDFESGEIPADWSQLIGANYDPDTLDDIRLLDRTTAPHIVVRPGEYACIFATSATSTCYLFSPVFTMASDSFIKFWTRFKGNDGTSQYPRFSVLLQPADLGLKPDYMGTYDANPASPEYTAWNDWESEWSVDITGLAGQERMVGFEVEVSNNYYTFTVDDILIGSYSGVATDPEGYEVYRNGTIATTINGMANTNWSDTGFINGDNTYFVRAIYPTGQSLASRWVTVNMNADPKPDYLTGLLNGSDDVELSWYMPYGTPSKWSTLIAPENCTTTIDYLDDTDCAQRRAEFKAEDVGLYYPVEIDSIAGGFFEWDDDLWGSSNTFIIRLWDGHPYDGSGTLLWESGTLTATSGEIYKVALDQTYVLNGEWNVEVEALDGNTGHPSTLAGPSTNGISCYFFYTLEDSYNYYVSSGGVPLSYCLMAHTTGAEPPPIAKSGWVTNEKVYETMPVIDNSGRLIENPVAKDSKEIDTYNIYRNASLLGTSSTTTYTDFDYLTSDDNLYYITAAYVNPAGESDPSNEWLLDTTVPDINLPASTGASAAPDASIADSFDIQNTGADDLIYDMTNAYVGSAGAGEEYHSEDFATWPGGYTITSGFVASGGGAYVVATNTTVTGVMTSEIFDNASALATVYLDFDYTFNALASGSSVLVEYDYGSGFVEVHSATSSFNGHKQIALPGTSANAQLRFTGVMTKGSGSSTKSNLLITL